MSLSGWRGEDMLEEIAVWFVDQSDLFSNLSFAAFWIFGAIFSFLNQKKSEKMPRSAYFLCMSAVYLFGASSGLLWIPSQRAIVGGYVWVLLLTSLAALTINGVLYARVALARARDAYGSSWMALLAFVPIVGFWLLFARSKEPQPQDPRSAPSIFVGRKAVVCGVLLVLAWGVVRWTVATQTRSLEEQAPEDELAQQAAIEFLVRRHGLEEALRRMVAASEMPVVIDDMTRLERVEVDGTQLTRIYFSKIVGAQMSEADLKAVEAVACENQPFTPLLRAGATIREVFVETGGAPIGSVAVTRETCGL